MFGVLESVYPERNENAIKALTDFTVPPRASPKQQCSRCLWPCSAGNGKTVLIYTIH